MLLTAFVLGLNDNCREISEQERFKLSSGKFEEGLQKLPQSKKPELWAAFIDQLAESYKTKISSGTEFETYLQKAHNEGCLSEMHYDYWLKLSRDQQVESVFKKGKQILFFIHHIIKCNIFDALGCYYD